MDGDVHTMTLVEPGAVAWHRVAYLQVKKYDVERRLELRDGPVTSMPLLGQDRRFAVEAVHRDNTWDRVLWTASAVEGHRLAHELAEQHGLEVRDGG